MTEGNVNITPESPLNDRRMRILVAPSGFKECLGPEAVADCIEVGLRRAVDENSAMIHKVPIHDGGEGFCKALVAAHRGDIHELTVMGPDGSPVDSHYGLIGADRKTAVIDMAAAAGLQIGRAHV